MRKYDEVVNDVITTLGNITYDDKDKQVLMSNFMYNIYTFIKDQDQYNMAIFDLNKGQERRKKMNLNLGFGSHKKNN